MTDDPDEARPHPRWLSHSASGDYESCPRPYWHGYVDGTPPDRPTWRGWRFGRAVHATLEVGYGFGKPLYYILRPSSNKYNAARLILLSSWYLSVP